MPPAFWATYFARLAIVALVLAGMYFLARKLRDARFFARGSRRLNVLESAMLSPNAALHVVRAGDRYFLVGTGSVTPIAELRLAEIKESPDLDEASRR